MSAYFLSNGVSATPIAASQFSIGRSTECELQLTDRSVSRRHCSLTIGSRGVLLRDLKSCNGTYVNGSRIRCVTLRVGDIITVGNENFVLENTEHTSLWARICAFSAASEGVRGQNLTGAGELSVV